MDQKKEFRECLKEIEKLRSTSLKRDNKPNEDLLKSTSELAQNQLSCFQTINDFFGKVATNSSLKERLQFDKKSIVMPGRDSVLHFIDAAKAALEINKEVASMKKYESTVDKHSFENQRAVVNQFLYGELNSIEFNRCFRSMVQYFSAQPESPEIEEFGDSTVNTILSEDVLASSPINSMLY